jgi:hypothetical protein
VDRATNAHYVANLFVLLHDETASNLDAVTDSAGMKGGRHGDHKRQRRE